jgi:hypothetical protein
MVSGHDFCVYAPLAPCLVRGEGIGGGVRALIRYCTLSCYFCTC